MRGSVYTVKESYIGIKDAVGKDKIVTCNDVGWSEVWKGM